MPLLSVNADNLSQTNLKNIGNNENPKLRHSELDCARYLLMGKPMREIAEELLISPRTVETHIENIKNKLGCNKKSEVISKLLKRINPFLFFEEKNYE